MKMTSDGEHRRTHRIIQLSTESAQAGCTFHDEGKAWAMQFLVRHPQGRWYPPAGPTRCLGPSPNHPRPQADQVDRRLP